MKGFPAKKTLRPEGLSYKVKSYKAKLQFSAEIGPRESEIQLAAPRHSSLPRAEEFFARFFHAAVAIGHLPATRTETDALFVFAGLLQFVMLHDQHHGAMGRAPQRAVEQPQEFAREPEPIREMRGAVPEPKTDSRNAHVRTPEYQFR